MQNPSANQILITCREWPAVTATATESVQAWVVHDLGLLFLCRVGTACAQSQQV